MTPATHEHQHRPPNPYAVLIGTYLFYLLVLTPVVALAWNLGLNGAGIVDHTIDWSASLGLAFGVMILRSIVGAARANIGLVAR